MQYIIKLPHLSYAILKTINGSGLHRYELKVNVKNIVYIVNNNLVNRTTIGRYF